MIITIIMIIACEEVHSFRSLRTQEGRILQKFCIFGGFRLFGRRAEAHFGSRIEVAVFLPTFINAPLKTPGSLQGLGCPVSVLRCASSCRNSLHTATSRVYRLCSRAKPQFSKLFEKVYSRAMPSIAPDPIT